VQKNDIPLRWRRSEFCANDACVEVAQEAGLYLVRDSKDPSKALLVFDQSEWDAFVAGVRAGDFDFE
jgi:hypothetical protein